MRIGITFHTTDEFISGVQYYTLGLINALLRIDAINEYFIFTNQSSIAQKYLIKAENLRVVNCDGPVAIDDPQILRLNKILLSNAALIRKNKIFINSVNPEQSINKPKRIILHPGNKLIRSMKCNTDSHNA